MKTVGTLLVLVAALGLAGTGSEARNRRPVGPAANEFRPSPEMQRLFDVFNGKWKVAEHFEISGSRQGGSRLGTASFRSGPGFSLIEDYTSKGSAGPLHFFALLWWDQSAQAYRLLTCANNDGCRMRGTAKWEGNTLVNSWTQDESGKPVAFRDSFEDISPRGFRLVSEGMSGGKIIWRVVTQYTRLKAREQ